MPYVYLDELAALNFIVDYLLLSASGALSSVYAPRLRRMAAAALGAAHACAAFLLPGTILSGTAGKLAGAGAMVLCAFGFGDLKRCARRIAVFLLCGALFAGFVLLAGGAHVRGGVLYADTPGIVILALCVCAYAAAQALGRFSARTAQEKPKLLDVRVREGEREARFFAMLDTGNRLRDPFSGRQVLVCALTALRGVLPERVYAALRDTDAARAVKAAQEAGARRFRLIPYRALGTEHGLLPAFCPQELWLDGKRNRDVLIAVAQTPFEEDAPYSAVMGI